MSELEKFLRNMLLGGVGVAATAAEKAEEVMRAMVAKGNEVVTKARDQREALERELNETREELREELACEDAADSTGRARIRETLNRLDQIEEELAASDDTEVEETMNEFPAEEMAEEEPVETGATEAEPQEAPTDQVRSMLEELFGQPVGDQIPEELQVQIRQSMQQVGDLLGRAMEMLRGRNDDPD